MKRTGRYQVLYDNQIGQPEEFSTRRRAEIRKEILEKEGQKNVTVWDTKDNTLSKMLGF